MRDPASLPAIRITSFRFEHHSHTLGIGVNTPRLSWIIATSIPNWQQAAYELELLAADGTLREQTSRIVSNDSVLVTWPFTPIQSRERVQVRVRVWGADGSVSAWADPSSAEAGLLAA